MLKSIAKNLLASVIYYSGFIKILKSLGRNYVKILIFHSVNDRESGFIKGTDVWTSSEKFEKYLKYIAKNYQVISLKDLVVALKRRKIPKGTVVITFDDGFADNYHFAYPLLKHYKMPATMFLVTDCIENKRPIWIQELYYLVNYIGVERLIEAFNELKEVLQMPQLEFRKNRRRNLNPEKSIEEYLSFSVSKEVRGKILDRLYIHFKLERERIFNEGKIFLNWDQVKQMSQDGISFGNHGASHTPFSAMAVDEQEEEIVQSKKVIEKYLNKGFMPFSYPYGWDKYFTRNTKRATINSGHSCALTAMPTLNGDHTSPFELGRIDVKNVPVSLLAFEMEKGIIKKYLGLTKD